MLKSVFARDIFSFTFDGTGFSFNGQRYTGHMIKVLNQLQMRSQIKDQYTLCYCTVAETNTTL